MCQLWFVSVSINCVSRVNGPLLLQNGRWQSLELVQHGCLQHEREKKNFSVIKHFEVVTYVKTAIKVQPINVPWHERFQTDKAPKKVTFQVSDSLTFLVRQSVQMTFCLWLPSIFQYFIFTSRFLLCSFSLFYNSQFANEGSICDRPTYVFQQLSSSGFENRNST